MTPYAHLRIEYAKLLGEYKGFATAVTMWDIPAELRAKIEPLIKQLEEIKLPPFEENDNKNRKS